MRNASLVVVGSGIKFIAHLTTEAKAYIEQSNKVLFLVNEPAMKKWLLRANPNAESLDKIYTSHKLRQHCYTAITEYILKAVRENQHVCVVLYGHPTVFAKPALDAVIQARQEGYFAKILPGISSEDCLFADLLIDPASNGCLSFEATDLLIHQRKLDISCHVILWQVSVIGMLDNSKTHNNKKGINLLFSFLNNYYNSDHQIISYTAAQYPGFEPIIENFSLEQLPNIQFSRISTLYIPPAQKPICKTFMLAELDINLDDVKNNNYN